jgi:hypothetical protein
MLTCKPGACLLVIVVCGAIVESSMLHCIYDQLNSNNTKQRAGFDGSASHLKV